MTYPQCIFPSTWCGCPVSGLNIGRAKTSLDGEWKRENDEGIYADVSRSGLRKVIIGSKVSTKWGQEEVKKDMYSNDTRFTHFKVNGNVKDARKMTTKPMNDSVKHKPWLNLCKEWVFLHFVTLKKCGAFCWSYCTAMRRRFPHKMFSSEKVTN